MTDINKTVKYGDLLEYTNELSKKITFNTNNLYEHYINLSAGQNYNKLTIKITNTSNLDLTETEVHNYIKQYFTTTKSYLQSNILGLPCIGATGGSVSTTKPSYAIAWCSDVSNFCVAQAIYNGRVYIYELPELTLNEQISVPTAINNVDNLGWRYVGELASGSGSNITVGTDWKDLLFIIRVAEGSAYYNLSNIVNKLAFTQGSPTNNTTFIGLTYNTAYYCNVRLQANSDISVITNNLKGQQGWTLDKIYVYKK